MTTPSKLPDNKEAKKALITGNHDIQSNNSPLSQEQFGHVWTSGDKQT